jgi:UDP-2-acetamido-2-deoxy-ribo-hexuluronate aminotransferase
MQFIDLKAQYAALKPQIDARIQRVLNHGQYIMGPEVEELESKLANYVGAAHCVTVSSGTEALLIALMALGIKPGDEVITSPFSFVATAEMIVLLGARPVFVDVEPDTCIIDATVIESKVTSRTKAIMPVSLYGQPPDMDAINAVASRHGIPVIEDGAQSFGATYRGKQSCSMTTFGCTSFFPSKPLGCYGDGGAIFTSDNALAIACREIRVHGQSKRYHHTRVGVGGRMDTLQCAVVLGKFDRFEWEIEQRRRLGARYSDLLAAIPGVTVPVVRSERTSVYAQYTLQVERRSALIKALHGEGIPTAIHYPTPLNRQPAYKENYDPGRTPVSDGLSERVMSLPLYSDMSDAVQDKVIAAVRAAVNGCQKAA